MTFGLLGDIIHNTADFASAGVHLAHRNLDDTLDKTGLSAFIPPALHEVSDGAQGLLSRGIHDVGATSGAILNSFDKATLHGHDKDIGGNLRSPRGQQQPPPNQRPLCKYCQERPRLKGSQFCSDRCADDYDDVEDRGPSRRRSREDGGGNGQRRRRESPQRRRNRDNYGDDYDKRGKGSSQPRRRGKD
ncbi:hypothetical protein VNI00_013124 [Paramarasmius palmivorus]|uniref:Uncharacterized protein n=1 Tax=Paramarasmius palmivorus TaxID=297713 RepID=A0AAW0BYK8_9AGAR